MKLMGLPSCWAAIAAALLLVGVGACGEDKPAAEEPTAPAGLSVDVPSNPSGGNSVYGGAKAGAPVAAAQPAMVAPPADARYTLYCTTVSGPDHAAEAVRLRDEVMAVTHWKDWYVVHRESESVLYYGYFRSVSDTDQPAENKRAHSAVTAVTGLTNRMGDHPFSRAMLVPLDAPDPDAPPEWNLCNVPADKYWSVEIASYTGSPERKKAAVDAVRAARAMGIEAYYYHGESASSVCVGAWPADAIQRQEQATVSASPANPDQTLMYVPGEMADHIPPDIRDRDGKQVKVLTDKVVILDQTMKQTLLAYPHFAVNGDESVQVVNGQQIFQASAPVVIPRHGPSLLDSGAGTASGAAEQKGADVSGSQGGGDANGGSVEQQPADAGGGQLRSLGH